jgi:hypothetical protein
MGKSSRLERMGRIAGLGTVYAVEGRRFTKMKSRDFDFVNWKHDDYERPTMYVHDGLYVAKPSLSRKEKQFVDCA